MSEQDFSQVIPDGAKAPEKVIDKIKKMLAIAKSSTMGDAEAAMGMVMEFLTRHNLTLQDVEAQGTKEYKHVKWTNRETCLDARWYARYIVERHFNVMSNWKADGIHFVGTPTNVEIAMYIYGYLTQLFDILWQIYELKAKPRAKNAQESYIRGLYEGLTNKLWEEKKRVQKEMGLVLVADPGLIDFYYEKFPEEKPDPNAKPQKMKRYAAPKFNEKALEAGREKGKDIRINKGVRGGGPDPKQLN